MGGIEEYEICDARLFKPVVAWCIGTCAKLFSSEVQFGHAGAFANAERETAEAKNKVGLCVDVRICIYVHVRTYIMSRCTCTIGLKFVV